MRPLLTDAGRVSNWWSADLQIDSALVDILNGGMSQHGTTWDTRPCSYRKLKPGSLRDFRSGLWPGSHAVRHRLAVARLAAAAADDGLRAVALATAATLHAATCKSTKHQMRVVAKARRTATGKLAALCKQSCCHVCLSVLQLPYQTTIWQYEACLTSNARVAPWVVC